MAELGGREAGRAKGSLQSVVVGSGGDGGGRGCQLKPRGRGGRGGGEELG